MKPRHPQTGALYVLQDDGLMRVEQDGRAGLFDAAGRWQAGELRDADPQMIDWVGGPQRAGRNPHPSQRRSATPRGHRRCCA